MAKRIIGAGAKRINSSRAIIGERSKTHGMSRTRTYKIWFGMKKRCKDESSNRFASYGGRGIRVCERWEVFENFLADMGECPAGMSIDRIDTNGNYEPSNCRWASAKEQARNRRYNKLLTANGETKPVAEWAEQLGIDQRVIHLRLKRGWTEQQAIDGTGQNLATGARNAATRLPDERVAALRAEQGKSTRQLAREYGISQSQVRNILSGKHRRTV